MVSKLTFGQIQNILNYVNLDEGFEQEAEDFMNNPDNHRIISVIEQYKNSRKFLEEYLRDEESDRIAEECGYE